MSLGADTIYNVVTAAIALSFLIANFILSLVSLFKCRRQGDPARQGLRWVKLSGALLNVYLVCVIITCILSALYYEMGYHVQDDRHQPFIRARACFDALIRFFVELTCATLFITFVSLGFGILHTRASTPEAKGPPGPRLWATKATASVLAALAVALLGLSIDLEESTVVRYSSSDPPDEDFFEVYNRRALIVQRLSGTLTFLFFIASVVTMGYSFYVVVRASRIHGHSKKPAILLIVAATLYLERNLYRVILTGLFYNFTNDTLSTPQYLPVLTIIFEAVPLVLLFILLSSLAQLKKGGLWYAGSAYNPPAQQQYPRYHQQPLHGGTNGTLQLGQQPVHTGWTYQHNAQRYVESGTGM